MTRLGFIWCRIWIMRLPRWHRRNNVSCLALSILCSSIRALVWQILVCTMWLADIKSQNDRLTCKRLTQQVRKRQLVIAG